MIKKRFYQLLKYSNTSIQFDFHSIGYSGSFWGLAEMLPVVTKCIKRWQVAQMNTCAMSTHCSKGLNLLQEVEEVAKQAAFWEALSIITKGFLSSIIVESTDAKYMPSRTDGRALGHSLAATKCHKLGKSD